MPTKPPQLYVIAGPNGAGKTTFARSFLPDYAKCREFVNADLIAAGLSPFSPERTGLQAGKLLLQQIDRLAARRESFGFETTLAGVGYVRLFRRLRRRGYLIRTIFLWIPTVELALERIRVRVKTGGHSVPEADVRRRFSRGLKNFFTVYRPLCDSWALLDNSEPVLKFVALGHKGIVWPADREQYRRVRKQAGLDEADP
jgi:predicted ABC-type ATPase